MVHGAGACWHVVGVAEQVYRDHSAREVEAENPHMQEVRQSELKLHAMRRLLEHHTLVDEEEVVEWREGQARIETEQHRVRIVV